MDRISLKYTCPSPFSSSIDEWSWPWFSKRRRRSRLFRDSKPFHQVCSFGWQCQQRHTDQTFHRWIWALSLLQPRLFSLLIVISILNYNFSKNHQDSTAAPQDTTRHPFLTPVRPSPIKEIGFTILRNASDRVTEILRENRRRLDAGEDPNTIRSTLDLNHCFFVNKFHSSPFLPLCIRGSSSQTRHGTFCCS